MQRIITFLIALTLCLAIPAQNNSGTRKRATTSKTVKKKTTKKKTSAKKKAAAKPTNASIRKLEREKAAVRKKLQAQQAQLRRNKADVKKGLHNLMLISSDIDKQHRIIDSINNDVKIIEQNIKLLNGQLLTLNQKLGERKERYIKAIRNMNRKNTFQDRLMFFFSAESFSQMYRRMSQELCDQQQRDENPDRCSSCSGHTDTADPAEPLLPHWSEQSSAEE